MLWAATTAAKRMKPLVRGARPLVRRVGDSRAMAALTTMLERVAEQPAHRLPVLMYHRVTDARADGRFSPGVISATPADFARQMQALSRRYRFISLDELVQIRRQAVSPRRRSVLLTFDEGYRDFVDHVSPVIEREGIPATIFVATAFPNSGRSFWWDEIHHAVIGTARRDPLHTSAGTFCFGTIQERGATLAAIHKQSTTLSDDAFRALLGEVIAQLDVPPLSGDVLSWEELVGLSKRGVSVSAHTDTHPRLTRLDDDALERELIACQVVLRQRIGSAPPVIAYPAGDHDDRVVSAAERAGFEIGFSTRRGVNDLRSPDWMRLDRINVGRASSESFIRMELALLPRSRPTRPT
jgi:peptidoglycan/xylan/chitin deacetylase (PgdA/CDA1 family)